MRIENETILTDFYMKKLYSTLCIASRGHVTEQITPSHDLSTYLATG